MEHATSMVFAAVTSMVLGGCGSVAPTERSAVVACSEAKRGDQEHVVVLILDEHGSLIPGATIVAALEADHRTAVTDQYGQADLALSPGNWQITASIGPSEREAQVPLIVRDRCIVIFQLPLRPGA